MSKCEYCGARWNLGDNQWVRVKDKLPKPNEYVLVSGGNQSDKPTCTSISKQDNGVWEMLNEEEGYNAVTYGDCMWDMAPEDITHWMPLPQLPQVND